MNGMEPFGTVSGCFPAEGTEGFFFDKMRGTYKYYLTNNI